MDGSTRQLSRRAFVRGAVLTTVAAAAATARPVGAALAQATAPSGAVPRLDVPEPVAGVATRAGRLLAVGGHAASPKVWALPPGAVAWEAIAGSSSFPPATSLLDATGHDDGFLAAGWTESAEGPAPSVFTSVDGVAWEAAPLPGVDHGVALAVAAKEGTALAVGATFDEPGVREPVRTVAFAKASGGEWLRVPLDGVRLPDHGAVTMLMGTGSGFLLGTTDVAGSELYAAARAEGPWRSVRTPRSDELVAFLAAAATDAGLLLAGLDVLDRPRFFLDGARGWREVGAPGAIAAASHVNALTTSQGALVAAGDDASGSFVEAVTAA